MINKTEKYKIKFLPNSGKYAIVNTVTNQTIKEVRSAEEAGTLRDSFEEDAKVIVGFGDHIPAFILRKTG